MALNYRHLITALVALQRAETALETLILDNPEEKQWRWNRQTCRNQQQDLLQVAKQQLETDKFNGGETDGLTWDESQELHLGNTGKGKIHVIKEVRVRTGCGLADAKKTVESWMQKHLGFTSFPIPTSSPFHPNYDTDPR